MPHECATVMRSKSARGDLRVDVIEGAWCRAARLSFASPCRLRRCISRTVSRCLGLSCHLRSVHLVYGKRLSVAHEARVFTTIAAVRRSMRDAARSDVP
jgi:hypothetical protein